MITFTEREEAIFQVMQGFYSEAARLFAMFDFWSRREVPEEVRRRVTAFRQYIREKSEKFNRKGETIEALISGVGEAMKNRDIEKLVALVQSSDCDVFASEIAEITENIRAIREFLESEAMKVAPAN